MENIYKKVVTPYGDGAKLDAQNKYIGRKAFIILRASLKIKS